MQITVDIPDDMAHELEPLKDDLPQILALGLQQLQANPANGFSSLVDVLEFLATLPSPQQILDLRLSEAAQGQVDTLLEKNRNGAALNPVEQMLWQQYEFVEHLVRTAKAQALLKLQNAT
ncbi:MAG: hypothetical protein AAF151_03410 [Cyanobacteria bacterium J06656_5]